MKYFVFNPYKDDEYGQASRDAMVTYALSIERTNKGLAAALRQWVVRVNTELNQKHAQAEQR
jgi:hypothetical protein